MPRAHGPRMPFEGSTWRPISPSLVRNHMSRKLLICLFPSLVLCFASAPLHSQPLIEPKARVVLTVSGEIGRTNGKGVARFDMDMLNSLPQQTIRTRTPWYSGTSEFTGPLLVDVLALVEPTGTLIKARALNDYSVTIPVSDASNHHIVLATRLNGKPMSVRDKGPIFVIYPFDSKEELRASTYYARSIWQLKSMELK